MAMPKSKVKVKKKNGNVSVEMEDFSDQAEYFIHELTRRALSDVAKYFKAEWKSQFYQYFKRETGRAGKVLKYKVYSSKSTTAPRLEIGLKNSSKKSDVEGFYAFFQEFGTSNTNKAGNIVPKLGILQGIAKDNVVEIVSIESHYLSGLSEEASRLQAKVHEGDLEG